MDYSLIIRRATPTKEDTEAVISVMHDAFEKYKADTNISYSMEALEETYDDVLEDIKTKHVYIAFVDGNPVGSIRVSINNQEKTAYISRFGVSRNFQNIGIGVSFMNLVDKLLISKDIKRAMLHTATRHSSLVRFYYGCGFYIHSTSESRGYIRALFYKDY